MNIKSVLLTAFMIMLLISLLIGNTTAASADEAADPATAQKVSVGAADYESLLLKVYPNGNSIVYMSADKGKTWTELEGRKDADEEGNEYIETDISWASPTSNVTLIFKGNEAEEESECVLPRQISTFTVKYDKTNGSLEFTNNTEATTFWWRKASDYKWNNVPFDTTLPEHKEFLSTIESLRYKGAKLVFRTGQTPGTDADHMGNRPSKEIKVSIPKYANAPSLKLNLTKLTLNTKATMEFTTDLESGNWSKCEKNMSLEDFAPAVFIKGETPGTSVSVFFRVAQSEKMAASRIGCITFPAQTEGPSVGGNGNDVSCSENSSAGKYELKFLTASATNMIEYCVITPGNEFELTKAKWKTIKSGKTVALKEKAAPDGTVIYFRFKGTAENVKKGTEFMLPSACSSHTVAWKTGNE